MLSRNPTYNQVPRPMKTSQPIPAEQTPAQDPRLNSVLDTINRAIAASNRSLRDIARRAGTSHSTLIAYRKGRKTPSATNLLKLLEACGYGVDIQLRPRIREANGLSRGDELVAVLRLAEQFPARHQPTLTAPVFQQAR